MFLCLSLLDVKSTTQGQDIQADKNRKLKRKTVKAQALWTKFHYKVSFSLTYGPSWWSSMALAWLWRRCPLLQEWTPSWWSTIIIKPAACPADCEADKSWDAPHCSAFRWVLHKTKPSGNAAGGFASIASNCHTHSTMSRFQALILSKVKPVQNKLSLHFFLDLHLNKKPSRRSFDDQFLFPSSSCTFIC